MNSQSPNSSQINRFKNSARLYSSEISIVHKLEQQHPWLLTEGQAGVKSPSDSSLYEEYALLKSDIQFVNSVLKQIEILYGSTAKDVVRRLYILREDPDSVGDSIGYSGRRVQYYVRKYFDTVFDMK